MPKFVVGLLLFLLLVIMGQARHVAIQGEQECAEVSNSYTQTKQTWKKTLTFQLTKQFADLSQRAVISEPCDTLFKVKVLLLLKKEWDIFWKTQPHIDLTVPHVPHPHGRYAIDYYIYTLRHIVI